MSGKPTGDKRSLAEVHGSVAIPYQKNIFRRIFAIAGPAYLVAVGYMDPGNWATDIAAGSAFNYTLIWVLLMSNVMAILLQSLAFRLGIVRGLDLAQACRTHYPKWINLPLYGLCEIAITACDLAEVIGSAIALKLLFGLPLVWGVVITASDTLVLLFLNRFGIRKIEAMILGLITIIAMGLLAQVFFVRPTPAEVAAGFIPSIPNSAALFIAIGMLGATVMPHNLYLHSSLVQTRRIGDTSAEKKQAIKLNTIDSTVALNVAFFVNAAILIMAAGAFFRHGFTEVADIEEAHRLLEPTLGTKIAPLAFAIALLAAGQSSTVTGTLAGQIVMEGFLNFRISPWIRRLITRFLAIVPAVLTIVYFGERGTGPLLVLSQVILSLQLPFAIIPLIHFVSEKGKMGEFAIGRTVKTLAWIITIVIVGLNVMLVANALSKWIAGAGSNAVWIYAFVLPFAAGVGVLMLFITIKPLIERLFMRPSPGVGIHEPMEDLSEALGKGAAGAPYKKVAVALDFLGRDAAIIRETLRVLGSTKPRLALMHVVESATARFLGGDAADVESEEDCKRLSGYAEQLRGMGYDVVECIGRGRPVTELARMIDDFGADLVVLGAHGHRFFSDLFFGATADRLRHKINASVLVVGKNVKV